MENTARKIKTTIPTDSGHSLRLVANLGCGRSDQGVENRHSQKQPADRSERGIGYSGLILPELSVAPIKHAVEVVIRQRSFADYKASHKEIIVLLPPFLELLARHQTIAEKLDTPMWDQETEPWQVLNWLIAEYENLIADKRIEWRLNIGEQKVGRKTKATCSIDNIISYSTFEYSFHAMSCDFLPELEKKDKRMFRFVFDTIAIIQGVGLLLWDYESEMHIDWYWETLDEYEKGSEEYEKYTNLIKTYESATEWAERIRRNMVDMDQLEQDLNAYRPKKENRKKWKEWCLKAIGLARRGASIHDFVNDYSTYGDDGVYLYDYVKFMWSMKDELYEQYCEMLDNHANECGVMTPAQIQTIALDNDNLVTDFKPSTFLYEICELLNEGERLESPI